MRQVTVIGGPPPTNDFERWVLQTLTEITNASQQNVISDVGASGAALSTLNNATGDQVPYYTGPAAVALTAFTALARSLVGNSTQAQMQSTLGLTSSATLPDTTWLKVLNYLSEIAAAGAGAQSTARGNLGLGSVATLAAAAVLQVANNLSEIAAGGAGAQATARGNISAQAYDAYLHSGLPVNYQTVNYTCAIGDANGTVLQATNGGQIIIPTHASVAYNQGTTLTFGYWNTGGSCSIIPAGGVTLYWSGSGGLSGTRTLGPVSLATAVNMDGTNGWIIGGSGLS